MSDSTVLIEAIQKKIGEVSSSSDTTTLHLLTRVATIVGQGSIVKVYNNTEEFPDAETTDRLILYSRREKKLYYNFGVNGWISSILTLPY